MALNIHGLTRDAEAVKAACKEGTNGSIVALKPSTTI